MTREQLLKGIFSLYPQAIVTNKNLEKEEKKNESKNK